MKQDLAIAINVLHINCDDVEELDFSFLDFAIMMALYYLKLHFMQRIISKQRKYERRIERHILKDRWIRFQEESCEVFDPKVAEILEELENFYTSQKNFKTFQKRKICNQEFVDMQNQ